MALLWLDGFDNYGTSGNVSPTGVLARKYASANPQGGYCGVSTGRLGGYSLYWGYDATVYFQTAAITTNDTLIIGFAFKPGRLTNEGEAFLKLYDGTTLGVNFRVTFDGEIVIYRGSTLLGTTSGANLFKLKWSYLEFKVKCNGSTGTYEVRAGGINVGSGTGLNTKAGTNNYHDRVRISGCSLDYHYYDDYYVCDSSGALNNDFLGNIRVITMRPDSAGDSTQFTPSIGTNYTCVDEQTCNDDTDYVDDSTTNDKDLYNYSASTLNTVKGVMACTDCRQTDATAYSLKTPCKSGSTETDDSAQAIGTTSFVTKMRLLETDPNTSSAWALTDLNAAQFGVKVG